jgi:hypothetical protein
MNRRERGWLGRGGVGAKKKERENEIAQGLRVAAMVRMSLSRALKPSPREKPKKTERPLHPLDESKIDQRQSLDCLPVSLCLVLGMVSFSDSESFVGVALHVEADCANVIRKDMFAACLAETI